MTADSHREDRREESSARRADHDEIVRLVPQGASVLDLGCADGALLLRLIRERGVRGDGVEIDLEEALECIGKGLNVYQGCIEDGLKLYEDQSLDWVILSETLQVLTQPRIVLREMLRVGRRAIVSFPNFAHWRLRAQLFFRGVMPMSRLLPLAWYDTPNIHLCTITDFRNLCREEGMEIEEARFPGSWLGSLGANLLAGTGIFVVRAAHRT